MCAGLLCLSVAVDGDLGLFAGYLLFLLACLFAWRRWVDGVASFWVSLGDWPGLWVLFFSGQAWPVAVSLLLLWGWQLSLSGGRLGSPRHRADTTCTRTRAAGLLGLGKVSLGRLRAWYFMSVVETGVRNLIRFISRTWQSRWLLQHDHSGSVERRHKQTRTRCMLLSTLKHNSRQTSQPPFP
jgi:hypothetical protein